MTNRPMFCHYHSLPSGLAAFSVAYGPAPLDGVSINHELAKPGRE
jgi:hypothetical protein